MIESASEFVRLRTSENPDEYHRAAHDVASDEVWSDVLASYPEMAFWVAHNKTISLCIMEILADSPDEDARLMLAMKRKCPHHLLRRLALDKNESVRYAVAVNKKTPLDILQILSSDEWETCASNARSRINQLGSG